jgi:hypothetical protein
LSGAITGDGVIALIAVLDACGAYLPLDPTFPTEGIAFMLEDSHAYALITAGEAVTIGRPIVNTQICMVGEDGRKCPRGEIGAIFVGGDGVARACRLTPALTATRATAEQVVKLLLAATASLIHHCRNHKTTDSATHQKLAHIVLAKVDGEPVGPASSKPAAPLVVASPLKRSGEDARKSIKAGRSRLPRVRTRPNKRTNRFKPFNNWDASARRLGPYRGAG